MCKNRNILRFYKACVLAALHFRGMNNFSQFEIWPGLTRKLIDQKSYETDYTIHKFVVILVSSAKEKELIETI